MGTRRRPAVRFCSTRFPEMPSGSPGGIFLAVGAGMEIPNAVITSVQRERVPSVTLQERVVVGVELWPVPSYSEYRYAVVNDRRVIVEPRTRQIIKIID
ncbi:DUF1236 domain-containing protein [Bradyrhizobium erythrophlei]